MDLLDQVAALEVFDAAANREKKWHRENYTPEHSPLAGEVADQFCHSVRYLPCLEYKREWKSNNINVRSHSLSNLNFNPRYLNHKRFEGIRILEHLPTELRWMIYKELVHSWCSFKPYPETYSANHGARVGMARRNRFPMFGASCDFPISPCIKPCESSPCLNDTKFEQKFGTLDYFKQSEWENIKSSVKAMEEFQNFRDRVNGLSFWGHKREATVDVLEDFITWFWDEVVLDVQFHAGHMQHRGPYILPESAELYRFPVSERILHSHIRHITLEASTGEAVSDWFLRWRHGEQALPHRGPNHFIQRCKFITAHLPNLHTASVFVKMDPDAFRQVKCHRKGPVAGFKAMTPWLRTILKIPAKERLDLAVFVTPGTRRYNYACQSGECQRYRHLNELVYRALGGHVSPFYVNRFDGDQYFGLPELFQED